ncbi:MAG: coenzyme F420-0:L-glutamate ligase [Eubacteriales bacterium]|jgi:F420-0:gamma-glutamyl ligase|nr:coenzyme F420-0:L-glutamate ligase [Eubacteriales bacterium]
MAKLPAYIGPAAFGLKMGVIVPGSDLLAMIVQIAGTCHEDSLLDNGDVLCVTESVLARSQNNYVTIAEIAREVQEHLQIGPKGKVGVVFPIASRNRFAMVLEAIAAAVPEGEVVVQLSWPRDEVGNQIISEEFACSLGKVSSDPITPEELAGHNFKHPITQVDYIQLYRQIIQGQGARATILLSNDPKYILTQSPQGVIVSDIHNREKTLASLSDKVKTITLADLCSSPSRSAWSEWGLLGSNMSSGDKLKLAPRSASAFARDVQREVARLTGKEIEVIIYGDGAYKDPTTQIYELADPKPVFGATPGFTNLLREGFKYKYLVDFYHQQGQSVSEIEDLLKQKLCAENRDQNETEGTTPRRLEDVIASLADLVSGSADAGTPAVLVKGFFD